MSLMGLSRQDMNILGLASLGGALEFYDFIIFVFFAPVISAAFFPENIPRWVALFQTLGIFSTGYLFRPLGGVVLAQFGDLFGRKNAFAFSILLMGFATLGIALMPTYAALGLAAPILLLMMRILQGAAIGGEVPGAWTFVAEHMPRGRIGFACGFLCAGLASGILLGSVVATGINLVFAPEQVREFAWRIPFLLGGIFGLGAVFVRRSLQETPVFREMRGKRMLTVHLPLKTVFLHHKRAVALSMIATWVLSAGVVSTLMLPALLQSVYHHSADVALTATSLATLFLIVGCFFSGLASDRIGLSWLLIAGSVFFAAASYGFYRNAGVPDLLYGLSSLMGLSVGLIAVMPCIMVRSFPTAVRFTGVSFSYNVAYAICGGATPLLIALAIPTEPMAQAYYLLFIALMAFALGVAHLARQSLSFPSLQLMDDDERHC
jgi:MFS family permease